MWLLIVAWQGWAPSAVATHNCARAGSPKGPFQVIAYDAKEWRKVYSDALTLAGFDGLFPGHPYFGLQPIEKGPRNKRTTAEARYIPPGLLKAIGWIESNWAQADFSVPYGSRGPVLVSHSCAYGVMQVLSGLENTSGTPTPEQLMVASHYAYNMARGAWILADKWNAAPGFRPIVGDGDPQIIEDWYYAVWSYNGFAFVNHPLNPAYSAWPRTPYSCGPSDDGFGHDYSRYPFQELVFGCLSHPPSPVVDDQRLPLWPPQVATLPDLGSEEVFKAMDVVNFLFHEERMDIPRPQPSHKDPTERTGDRRAIVGDPRLTINKSDFAFQLFRDGADPPPEALSVEIRNPGTGLLVWMAVPAQPWLVVSPTQGIALGSDLGDVVSAFRITVDASRLTPGLYQGTLMVVAPFAAGAPKVVNVRLALLERAFVPGVVKD